MKYRKFRQNKKAISPIISTLLLIAIAVVASLVAYAWVMGYIGFQTAKTGQAIQIQSVSDQGASGTLIVYVQNIGQAPISFNSGSTSSASCVFVNGQAVSITSTTPTAGSNGQISNVPAGSTVTFNTGFSVKAGDTVTVKVNSADGTFNSMTYTFTS